MIAYNNTWLANEEANTQIENAFANGYITPEEKTAAEAKFLNGFYTPNIFIRIGLFVLTLIIILFSFGIISLLFLSSSASERDIPVVIILFGFICYIVLERFIKLKKHYRSGVDDALLWAVPAFILTGLNSFNDIDPLINAALILGMAFYFTLRFADKLMALIAAIALLAVIFFLFERLGAIGKNSLPFVLMLASALIYFGSKRLATLPAAKPYAACLTLTSITGLLSFYIAGNFFIVREASIEFFGLDPDSNVNIPFAWFFWAVTFAMPLLYIFWGLFKKDRILIRTGLLLVAAMVFTVRYYYDALPIETLMIAAGILMTLIAYLLIKYLKEPKFGFTSEAEKNSKTSLNIEALIIAETLSGEAQPQTDTRFGGGSFGGGGASGEF